MSEDDDVFVTCPMPGGSILEMTKAEFDRVVDVFRMLQEQHRLMKDAGSYEHLARRKCSNRDPADL